MIPDRSVNGREDRIALLIKNLPAIFTALGILFTACVGVITLVRTNSVELKTDKVHELVNSQFSEAKREIQAAKDEVAALKREIAMRPGATAAERVRADVATEQQRQPLPLPKEKLP